MESQVRPYVIDEGYYAMTVEVDEVVSYHGSGRMDLLVLISSPHDNGHKIAKMVLQNVTVLSTTVTETIGVGSREARSPVMSVTVQVTPEEAKRLTLAESEGKLQLVLNKSGLNN
jgi:Flp pilus assembly protein CpaB